MHWGKEGKQFSCVKVASLGNDWGWGGRWRRVEVDGWLLKVMGVGRPLSRSLSPRSLSVEAPFQTMTAPVSR